MEYRIGNSVFNDWVITREIGEGATGKVFEIKKNDAMVSAKAALKIIRIPKSASDVRTVMNEGMDEVSVTQYFREFVDEILREIRIMVSLKDHPNIVAYEDHCVLSHGDGVGWDILIKMELLTPLADWQYNHPLDEETVLRLGCEISSALAYAMDSSLVHRDVKLENIFVDHMGRFKLGDFGIARTIEKTTGGLSKKGTESYMAPEVYLGKNYNEQIDIYSLGIVLYRLMNNNRLPFYPPFPEKISFTDRENALSKRMQGIPIPAPANGSREFQEIILKACEYLPENRYESMHEVYNVLQKLGKTPREIPKMPEWSPQAGERSGMSLTRNLTGSESGDGANLTGSKTGAGAANGSEATWQKNSGMQGTGNKSYVAENQPAAIATSDKHTTSGAGKGKRIALTAAGLLLAAGIGGAAVFYGMEYSKTYEVTIESGSEKGDSDGTHHRWSHVTVVADAPEEENVEFSRWIAEGIDLSEEDQKTAELTFTMPKENVSLKAQYKLKTEVTTIKGADVSGINYMGEDEDKVISGDIALTPAENPSDVWQGYQIIEPCIATTYIGCGSEGYQLVDVNRGPLTEEAYRWMEVDDGWIVAQDMDTELWGVLSMNGEVVIPFEHEGINVDGSWIVARGSGNFTVYNIDGDTCTSAVFSEDELGKKGGFDEDELFMLNLKTKKFILYDKDFNIVDAVDEEEMTGLLSGYDENDRENSEGNYKITENAARVMSKSSVLTRWKTMIENGYAPGEFNDGFTDYVEVRSLTGNGSSQWGVADKNGELIVPIEYDNRFSGLGLNDTNGFYSDYIMVVKDRKAGFIRKDGQVTVEPDTYIIPFFEPDYVGEQVVSVAELGFVYTEADGTYTLVAADGTITSGFTKEPQMLEITHGWTYTDISLWKITNDDGSESLIDWHGNVVYKDTDGIDTQYLMLSKNRKILFWGNPEEPYDPFVLNRPI